jgi:peptidoglycan hydrolase-like protein with peptidoglycan-binding domain
VHYYTLTSADRRRLLLIAKSVLLPRSGRRVANGSARNAVSDLQILLNRTGSDLVVDGVLGPLTQAELRRFQKAQGLKVDGSPSVETWARLRDLVSR